MVYAFPIAAGGEGIFWLIVVVFVIVSQIAKAAKKGSSPQGTPPFGGPDATSPEEELSDFLKRLTEGARQQTQHRPAPPPLPAAAHRPPPLPTRGARRENTTLASQRAKPQPRRREHTAAETITPAMERPVASSAAQIMANAVRVATPMADTPAPSRMRKGIMNQLKDTPSVRTAILLREVLSPPLAFRRQGWDSIAWSAGR